MIKPEIIQKHLLSRGYRLGHSTTRKAQYTFKSGSGVYLNLASKSGRSSLIIEPVTGHIGVVGVIADLKVGKKYFHSSNMLGFPTRVNRGNKPIPYGISLSFDSESALQKLLDHIEAA
ncbi:Protein of unknown function DUF2002 [Comamonadaceae bacterium]